jgi:mannosyltransferase
MMRLTRLRDLNDIEVIAPNLKRRLSGVTATIVRLIPIQRALIGIAVTGAGLPDHLPRISWLECLRLTRRRGVKPKWRVWHARRNTEMLAGLVLRLVFRRRLKLLFTSASQREHSGYTKWLISKMDGLIATSKAGQGYLTHPSQVILHGIDTAEFSPVEDKARLRVELGLPDQPIVGCFGRVRHQKGTDVFVDAMIEVMADNPNVHALVMGRATPKHVSFENALKTKVAAAGLSDRFHFPGEVTVEEIRRYYQALDLFVAPQRWEGFGLTPLEAMACGVPAVATTVGAFPELVVEGETGYLVPAGDVPSMSQAILTSLTDSKRLAEMSRQARNHVVENFRIQGEAARIVDVYKSLLGTGDGK